MDSIKPAFILAAAALAACVGPQPSGRREGVKLEDLTLDKLVVWPTGKDYIEASGHGSPPEGEKNKEKRRKAAREEAAMDAQKGLIVELQKVVPRESVREMLRHAEVGKIEYGYDDACALTLKVSREFLTPAEPLR